MAIDFLSQKRVEEQNLRDLILQRRPSFNLAGVQAGRAKTGIPIPSSRIGDLDFLLSQKQATMNFGQNRTRLNLLYEEALRIADDRGMSLRDSEQFARKVVEDEILRGRERETSRTNIERIGRRADIAEEYANRGLELEGRYQENDSSSALARILFGLGTAVGTGAYLYRKRKSSPRGYGTNIETMAGRYGISGGRVGPERNLGYFPEYPSFYIRHGGE